MSTKAWTPDKMGFVACYPNIEKAGAASLGIDVITRIADDHPRFVADKCYLPDLPSGNRLASTRIGAPLTSFSLVGFSCPFEPDYPNVVWMMRAAGIPLLARDRAVARAEGNVVPVVIAGGIAISSNPLPLLPLFDFVFLFDAELSFKWFLDAFPAFIEGGHESVAGGLGAWWDGFKEPSPGIIPAFKYRDGVPWSELFSPITCKLNRAGVEDWISPSVQSLADPDDCSAALGTSYLLEVGRGCGEGCRFCLVGNHQRPPSFMPTEQIAARVSALAQSKFAHKKVALIATNIADHPDLASACRFIVDAGFQVSIPSTKPVNDTCLLDVLSSSKIKSITVAPETGSDRLRVLANKKVTNAEYESAIAAWLKRGVSTIKVYLMFGLPGETPDDLDETIALLERVKDITAMHGARLTISLNPFIPKLGTPFMFHVDNYLPDRFKDYKRAYGAFARRIEKAVRGRVDTLSIKDAQCQAVLSLGGVEIADHLMQVPFTLPDDTVQRTLAGVKGMMAGRSFPPPFDCIVPLPLSYIKAEWKRAMAGLASNRCAPPGSCSGCGHAGCDARSSVHARPD